MNVSEVELSLFCWFWDESSNMQMLCRRFSLIKSLIFIQGEETFWKLCLRVVGFKYPERLDVYEQSFSFECFAVYQIAFFASLLILNSTSFLAAGDVFNDI